ncbi:hypothetical protein MHW47_10810 [Streptomyces sp. OfavH-34-F]|uniref:hypothetical protein n=1 Tax=Streptomyces sp. OfavH-34-F TaxID=2917760 RepID=UPI001EF298A0|nr:hypothetical protein [Streptomyces sp. OfavH-34-F]MCG7524924.1 hypothetical protein [Streptomyces sp. OfavH-34-F]
MSTPAPDIRPDAVDHLTRAQAAADLAAVREQWGDLLSAIGEPPRRAEWMPYERRGFLDQLAADDRVDDQAPAVGRLPLTIREHPAPLNLAALDVALAVEADVFEMCDAVAERVQLPARDPHGRWTLGGDPSNPRLWHLPTYRDAGPATIASVGSRLHGLHWATVWLEGRALDDDQDDRALFARTPVVLADRIAAVARAARRRVEGVLGREARTVTLDEPCPFCKAGRIVVHNGGGDPRAAVATCSTGLSCPAPVTTERGRRAWRGPALVGLVAALEAGRSVPAA